MSEIKHTAEPWEISESGMTGLYREIKTKAAIFREKLESLMG